MKQKRILLLASMALLMFGCKAQTSANEQAALVTAPVVAQEAPEEKLSASQLLEPKLKKNMPYADLRKIVLADGWLPLVTPECKENVGGEAEICDQQPEVEACSSDGHCNMFFISGDGQTRLRVGTYDESASFWEFSAQGDSNAEKPKSWDEVTSLSAEDCTQKGYSSFFEAFVKSDSIKKSHTAPLVKIFSYSGAKEIPDKYDEFKIGLIDYSWVLVDAAKEVGEFQTLNLKKTAKGNSFRVDFQKAEFGADEEIIKTFGQPGAYVFEMRNGCWQLTQEFI
jgi:hypothetical protein